MNIEAPFDIKEPEKLIESNFSFSIRKDFLQNHLIFAKKYFANKDTKNLGHPNQLFLYVTISKSTMMLHTTNGFVVYSSADISPELYDVNPEIHDIADITVRLATDDIPKLLGSKTELSFIELYYDDKDTLHLCVEDYRHIKLTPKARNSRFISCIQAFNEGNEYKRIYLDKKTATSIIAHINELKKKRKPLKTDAIVITDIKEDSITINSLTAQTTSVALSTKPFLEMLRLAKKGKEAAIEFYSDQVSCYYVDTKTDIFHDISLMMLYFPRGAGHLS